MDLNKSSFNMSNLLNAPIKAQNSDPSQITEQDGLNLFTQFNGVATTNQENNIMELNPDQIIRYSTPPRRPQSLFPPSVKEQRKKQRRLKRCRTPSPTDLNRVMLTNNMF
jgi:hypothetical protein